MRHEQIAAKDTFDSVDIAAVWPVSAQIAPLPLFEVEGPAFMPTPAAPDVPAAVGKLIASAYVALIAAFAIATVGPGDSAFMIAIAAFFIAMYFVVPRLMFAIEPKGAGRIGFDRFMEGGMVTATGHCSGRAALVQMLIVPVFLTFAVIAMGIAAAVIF